MSEHHSKNTVVKQLALALNRIRATPPRIISSPPTQPRRASVSLIIHVRPPAHILARADLLPPTPPTLNDFFLQEWVNHPDSVAELLYIRREGRDGKGAEGHVAFPGGRSEEGDEGALYTAMRQTWEEIGLDLADNEWSCVGQLDDREITTSLGKRLLMILSPFVFLHLSPHPPQIDLQPDSQTTVHTVPLEILPPFNKNPRTTFVNIDIASRLAPRNTFVRVFVRSLIGDMKFGAVLLPPHTAISAPGVVSTHEGDLKLWGLTLGMTLDLVQQMLEKVNARPMAPTAASAVFLGDGAASMTSIFPRFSIPDVNLWIWVFGKRYRDVIRGWEASMAQSGTNDRRINWSGSALSAFYGAVRRALVVVIVLRALGLLGGIAGRYASGIAGATHHQTNLNNFAESSSSPMSNIVKITVSQADIAKMIDLALLQPNMTDREIRAGLETAKRIKTATACIKPYAIPMAKEVLDGSGVLICPVIGFPHGNSTTKIKVFEATEAVKAGGHEIDMVINVGKALSGDWEYVEDEIRQINDAVVSGGAILKVIFENDYLNDKHIIKLCEICVKIGVAFVKTSTGYGFKKGPDGMYSYDGATIPHLALMRKHCPLSVQIKAAGGVKSLDDLLRVRAMGITRVGASAAPAIIAEAAKRGIGESPVEVEVDIGGSVSGGGQLELGLHLTTMSEPIAKDMAATAQAQAELNGIKHEDEAKGAVVHSFDPNMSPEEKAAIASKGRDTLKSTKALTKKDEGRELIVDTGGPTSITPTITIEDVDRDTKSVVEDPKVQNGQPIPGDLPGEPASVIPDWYKVGWRAHAGIDDPPPTREERERSVIEQWVSEMYYGEWYHNAAVIFFAVAASHYMTLFRLGWGWLIILLAICTTYYKTSIERFRRCARDDIQRELVKTRLEQDYESADWMNNFMDRFWRIYEPVLSGSITAAVDQVLAASTPAFLDSIKLTNFTLGTKAPRIERVYTSPRTDDDIVQMVWGFSFTPNDVLDMTHRESQNKVNPKIVLTVRVGKGLATPGIPILVEDMSFSGKMRVKLKLMHKFPHIQTAEVSFLQPPEFDYVLKPLGGDTFGFDVSNMPGLSAFIRETVHWVLGSMMYDPNVFTLNLEQLLSGAPLDAAIGVLQVTIFDARGLKGSKIGGGTPDPYVSLTINNRDEMARTKFKASTYNPHWGEVKFLVINSLTETLNLTILDHNEHRKDTDLGMASFELSSLVEDATQEGLVRKVLKDGKEKGEIKFDVSFFPILKPQVLEDGKIQPLPETKVGIVRLVVHNAKELDTGKSMSGDPNPLAQVLIRNREIIKTPTRKHTRTPVWETPKEFLVTDKGSTVITIKVKTHSPSKRISAHIPLKVIDNRDFRKDPVIGYMNIRLKDLLAAREKQQDWFPLSGCKSGKIRISADWRPLNMAGSMQGAGSYQPPIGIIRLWIKRAKDVKNVEATLGGKSDPYVRVMLNAAVMARTEVKNNNLNPEWDQIVYVPVHSLRETLYLECMDYQHLTKHRSLGFVELNVASLAKHTEYEQVPYTGTGKRDLVEPIRVDKGQKGELHYSAEFIPALALRGIAFEGGDDIQRAIDRAKGGHEDEDDVASGDESSVSSSDEELQRVPTNITVNSKGHRVTGHSKTKSADTTHTAQTAQTAQTDTEESELEAETPVSPRGTGIDMSVEELLKKQSGVLVFNIIEGQLARKARLEVLLDDGYWPVFGTEKARSVNAHWNQVGEGFIKELDFGRVWLRLNENDESDKESIVAEFKLDAKVFLEQSLAAPTEFALYDADGKSKSTIRIQSKYVPVEIVLDPRESINNMGTLHVELMDGKDLHAADRSGKSDPYVVFTLNGSKVFKSQTKKKTLAPEWDEAFDVPVPSRVGADFSLEVFDWNQVETAKSLGSGKIELADLVPFEPTIRHIKLSSAKHGEKGEIQIRVLFRSEIVAKTRTKTSTFSSAGRAMTQVGGMPLGAGRAVGRKALGLFARGEKSGSLDELPEVPPVPPVPPLPPTVERNGTANSNGAANGSLGSAAGAAMKPPAMPTPGPGTLKVTLHRAKDLTGIEEGDTAKPFVILKIGDKEHKSKHVKSNTPEWNETFLFPNTTTDIRTLHVIILDKRTFGKDPILAEGDIDIWRYIQPLFSPPILSAEVATPLNENSGTLQLRLEFEPSLNILTRTISGSGGSSLSPSQKVSSPSRFSLGRRPADPN
ncbi:hypothetical protein CTheo_3616 [Ceratobasidium theobromae]|uniref:deoxyribose-phosphate aldolase n=1 Tax=Ceratobasidium theobromae TaxID=1582974 RepID=A0A5N5QMA4_9AGAM|nr:hypothetical protein CTheo_3616 [Ceratobasidium theobromae]